MRGGKSSSSKMVEAIKSPPTKKSCRERNRDKLPPNASSTEIMEQHIWKEFPEDLFESVIARLPIATFFRFRSVCRRWNSLLASQSFSQHCAQVPQVYPWFYTIGREGVYNGTMYDPSLKKRHHHTVVPSLPKKMSIVPVSSAGGLVCFLDIRHHNFYVCNPLTWSLRELPPRLVQSWSRGAVGMTLNGNSSSNGYKILWLGRNGDHEVYDSVNNTWTCPGIIPPNIKLPLSFNFLPQAVSIDDTLYFMRSGPDGILSYNMASGVWKEFPIPPLPHLMDYTLAESKGRIMLVGLLTKNEATCVCIWELQKMTLLWKEVDKMPNKWCLEFYGRHVKMSCWGNRGLLMFSLRSGQMYRLFTYEVLSKEWSKVPGCMLPHRRKCLRITYGTAFHPCATAVA